MEEFEARAPEFVNNSESDQRAFCDYFDGIILDDIAAVNEAVHRLENLDTPFTDGLKTNEAFIMDQSTPVETIQEVVLGGLKAYVYSGVPVNKEIVLIVANRVGLDIGELRKHLVPSRRLIAEATNGSASDKSSDHTKSVLKWRGLTALRQIGIENFTDKVRFAVLNRLM